MTKKIAKSGLISRRCLLATVSAGAALAVSPFRIIFRKCGLDAFSL
jgi:branched-chain amino acid transport system substrate-binding protein